MGKIMDILFGCWHRHYSFPITTGKGSEARTYVVCLGCGRELPYSWEEMRVVEDEVEVA